MAPRNNQIRAHEKHHEVPSLKRETAHGLISAAHNQSYINKRIYKIQPGNSNTQKQKVTKKWKEQKNLY